MKFTDIENDKFIKLRHSNSENMSFIHVNYSKGATFRETEFIKRASDPNDISKVCRGLFLDDNKKPVVSPLRKALYMRNIQENIDSGKKYDVITKTNGFMLNITIDYRYSKTNPNLLFSTTGRIQEWGDSCDSATSKFTQLGINIFDISVDYGDFINTFNLSDLKSFIDRYKSEDNNNCYTLTFEACSKVDQHIVTEETGLYIIGADSPSTILVNKDRTYNRTLHSLMDEFAGMFPGILKHEFCEDVELCEIINPAHTHEGFVVYGYDADDLLPYKFKSIYYTTKKFAIRKSTAKMLTYSSVLPEWVDSEMFKKFVTEVTKIEDRSGKLLTEFEKFNLFDRMFS